MPGDWVVLDAEGAEVVDDELGWATVLEGAVAGLVEGAGLVVVGGEVVDGVVRRGAGAVVLVVTAAGTTGTWYGCGGVSGRTHSHSTNAPTNTTVRITVERRGRRHHGGAGFASSSPPGSCAVAGTLVLSTTGGSAVGSASSPCSSASGGRASFTVSPPLRRPRRPPEGWRW